MTPELYEAALARIAQLEAELAAWKELLEPTDAMCDAGYRALRERGADCFDSDDMRYAFCTMLSSAPKSPTNGNNNA